MLPCCGFVACVAGADIFYRLQRVPVGRRRDWTCTAQVPVTSLVTCWLCGIGSRIIPVQCTHAIHLHSIMQVLTWSYTPFYGIDAISTRL